MFSILFLFLYILKSFSCQQLPNFIPFGKDLNDQRIQTGFDGYAGPIEVPVSFPFFNETFNSFWVNTNGMVIFDGGQLYFNQSMLPTTSSTFIIPYFGQMNYNYGDVFYREINDKETLNKITNEIRKGYPEYSSYSSVFAFVTTWYKIGSDYNPSLRNTIQAVLSTNGKYSFAIFNYNDLQTANSYGSYYVQAGFNAGDGVRYYAMEGSFTKEIINIGNNSNVDIPGKWIFKIDSAKVDNDGCNKDGYIVIKPNTISYVGNEDIFIYGPCFNSSDTHRLYFDNSKDIARSVDCTFVDRSSIRCKTLTFDYLGVNNDIKLIVNGNENTPFLGHLNIASFDEQHEIRGLELIYESRDELKGQTELNWDPIKGLDKEDALNLYITKTDSLTMKTEYFVLKQNIPSYMNSTTIDLALINEFVTDSAEQYINQIVLYSHKFDAKTNNKGIAIWSLDKLTKIAALFSQNCDKWHSQQPDPTPIMNSLPPCPRFISSNFTNTLPNFKMDSSCNPKKPEYCDKFHTGAHGCYRSIGGKHAQQCCYNKLGTLLIGFPAGGTLDLANSDDSTFKHWKQDVLPYYSCCIQEKKCDKYYEMRPSDDGERWLPPRPTGGNGDPHFLTLDGLQYTFNGYGEFTLLDIPSAQFTIQTRILPIVYDPTMPQFGTVFKTFVVKYKGDKIQIGLNEGNEVAIYLNGNLFELNMDSKVNSLSMGELSIIISSSTSYTIQSTNQINVDISLTDNKDALAFVINLPRVFNKLTKGLLGFMDGNGANDFMLPNGTVIALNSNNDKDIFYKFGLNWRVSKENSIFTYENGFDHSSYLNEKYVPNFISNGIVFNDIALGNQAKIVCQENQDCLFDIATTKKISIGEMSVKFSKTIEEITEYNSVAVKKCSLLNSIPYGQVTHSETENGYEYRIICNEGYLLVGNSKIKCLDGVQEEVPKCKNTSGSASNSINSSLYFISMLACIQFIHL